MKTVKLTKKEKERIPTGFRKIFVKKILPKEVRDQLAVESKKYNKIVFEAYASEQPISKIVT